MTATAKVYGESLYELASEEKREDAIKSELRAVCDIFDAEPEYVRLLSNPALTKEERKKALDDAFGGKIDVYLLNFLKILTDNGTLNHLSGIYDAYTARYNADKGILPVECVSAVALSESERAGLIAAIAKKTGKKVVLTEKTDPALIGGVKLSYDGKLFDGTVAAKLAEIDSILKNTVL